MSFISGIFLNSFFSISRPLELGFFIFSIFLISVFWNHKKIVILGFCVLFLALGVLRYQLERAEISKSDLLNNSQQELQGTVSEDPEVKNGMLRIVLKLENAKEKILVITERYPEYEYGEKLIVRGKLDIPQSFEGWNYRDYLLKDGIYAISYFPEIEKIGEGFGNPVVKNLIFLKNKLEKSSERVFPSLQSGLLEALFFGDEENIPAAWKEKFNLVGVRHITAVSGMNITIISFLILNSLLALGFWRRKAVLLSVAVIIFYILMIGFSASAVRAGIMGIVFLLGQYLGRNSDSSQIVFFAAALMLLSNPLLLALDAGFQLSFLAMLGLIYVGPVLSKLLNNISDIFQIKYALVATLSAQALTLPVIIYNFGRIPALSPIVNIMITPLLSLVTILGFFSVFCGILSQILGQIIGFPVYLTLSYILGAVDFFSRINFSSFSLKISWPWLVFSYFIVFILIWQTRRKLTQKSFL